MKLHFLDEKIDDVNLNQSRLSIGREDENDISLVSEDISGFHAEIQKDGEDYFLIDLGSSNGSFHTGKRVTGRVQLKPWDQIAFASVKAEIIDPYSRRPTIAMKSISEDAIADLDPSKRMSSSIDDPRATRARPAATTWSVTGVSDDVNGQILPLKKNNSVGREASCDITLPNEMASREHAKLTVEGDRLVVEDLGSTNGTWVNNKRIKVPTTLKPGDEIRFDTSTYRVSGLDSGKTAVRKAVKDADINPVADQARAVLRTDGGKPIPLTGTMTVGRLADNDIVLDNDTVSGHHARIEASDGFWFLKDLGSSNGTTVAGKKVKQAKLAGGERICFGEVEVTLELAATGSTRHMKSIDSSGGTGTRIQTAIQDGTATFPTKKFESASSLPPWTWGVVGFAVVVLAAGAWLLWDRIGIPSQQIDAPLQAGQSWRYTLGEQAGSRSVVSTPVLADVNGDQFLDLVVADSDGFVTALDGQEGKRIFETPVPGRVVASLAVAELSGDGVDDIVVGTSGGRVLALNGDGQILWSSGEDLGLGQITNRAVFADVNADGVDDVIVPTTRRGLIALDGSRGWEIWSSEEMSTGAVMSTPVVSDFNDDGAVDFAYITESGQAVAISSASSRVWRLWASSDIGTPEYASPALIEVGDRILLITATDAGITALSAADGRMVWMARLSGNYVASPIGVPIAGNNGHDIVAISREGVVRVVSGDTGDVLWESNLGGAVNASPAVLDVTNDGIEDLLVQRADGVLFIIDSDRGRTELSVDLGQGSSISASPVLGDLTNDGLVEITAVDEGGRISAYTINRRIRQGDAVWPVMLGNQRHAVE